MKRSRLVWWSILDIGIGVGLLALLLLASDFGRWTINDLPALPAAALAVAADDADTVEQASPPITLAAVKIANVHQFAALEALFYPPDASAVDAAGLATQPYLLADYAAQCQAYMGTVPEFSCTDLQHSNIVTTQTTVVSVNPARDACPKLGIDEECVINGTVEGRLKAPADAPPGADVTILFSCRKYDTATPAGRFDDIAVIQHDKTTGNTCWFQSPTVLDLDRNGKFREDEHGYVVYKDWPGAIVPSPMSYGAQNFWIHPYHPDDVIHYAGDWVGEMRQGRRGIVADQDCQRCHDADAFVWTPYLTSTHRITDANPPTGWASAEHLFDRPYVSNFLGVFSADGIYRKQPLRAKLDESDNTCASCHTAGFGTNTMSGADQRLTHAARPASKGIVDLLSLVMTDTNRGIPWMPPPAVAASYRPLTETLRNRLYGCATGNPQAGDTCITSLPDPKNRPNLTLYTQVAPTIFTAGHEASYTIRLRNRGVYTAAHTATGVQLSNTLPVGITPLLPLPDSCSWGASNNTVTCNVGDLMNDDEKSVTLAVRVRSTISSSLITNKVAVKTADTADNIATIQMSNTNQVRRNVDLAARQSARLEPLAGSNPAAYKLTYRLTAANAGPAVAANVVLTQELPAEATYNAALSSERCSANARRVTCTVGDLADGQNTTINLVATVPVNGALFFTNQMSVAASSPDADPTNNTLTEVVFDQAVVQQQFLPVITRPGPRGPDLVVKAIQLTSAAAEVVIQNIGDAALPPSTPFWVDLYINPHAPPTGVNQTVRERGGDGLVWGVISPTLQLAPGQEYTLRVGGHYYVRDGSSVPPQINAGSVIYAQVDSANVESDEGGVREAHEINGGAYNNISSTQLTEVVSTARWQVAHSAK